MLHYRTLILVALCCLIGGVVGQPAAQCVIANCNSASCLCSNTKVPYGWAPGDPPQMIYLVFEGSLSAGSYPPYYKPLLDGLINPNNCPASATFFIDHQYTDYTTVNLAFQDGHDIGVQSITNKAFSAPSQYVNISHEIAGEALYLNEFGLLNATFVQGERAPQTASGGNNQFQAIVDAGLLYDSTLVSRKYNTPYWPYTLEFQTTQDCQIGPCPTNSFPGLWEFPITDLVDGTGNLCNNLLQCVYNASYLPDALSLLNANYEYHKAQTAPFLISVPLGWLFDVNNFNGLRQFVTDAIAGGAYVISLNKALAWFQNPTKATDITTFAPWLCDVPRDGGCFPYTCNYNFTGQAISMGFCTSPSQPTCPTDYPWINNLPF